jgi:hypothetical protein
LSSIEFEDELSEEGLLSTYYKKMRAGEPISLEQLMLRVMLVNEVVAVVAILEEEFG